jgi:glycerophosphoryl diester phosphodiesterase
MSFDAGEQQTIPTLDALLACVTPNSLCNLELKHLDNVPAFIQQLQSALLAHDIGLEQIIVSSFHHGWLAEIQALWPRLTVAYLVAHYPRDIDDYFETLPGHMINVALDVVDEQLIEAAHNQDKKVWVYTVNAREDMTKCKRMGADGIFTNYPQLAKRLVF